VGVRFINWAFFIVSVFTMGAPCLFFCLYCSVKGFEYLTEQG
jgi:hypothetical protein